MKKNETGSALICEKFSGKRVLSFINLVLCLYGEVNSVKKHNYKLWVNDGVY